MMFARYLLRGVQDDISIRQLITNISPRKLFAYPMRGEFVRSKFENITRQTLD